MMRWGAVVPMMMVVALTGSLSGCGSSTETSTATTSTTATPTPEETADGNVADQYCEAVDEFLAAAKKAAQDPLKADTDAVKAQVAQLRERAAQLAGELFNNPEGIAQVQQCTQRLQEFSRQG